MVLQTDPTMPRVVITKCESRHEMRVKVCNIQAMHADCRVVHRDMSNAIRLWDMRGVNLVHVGEMTSSKRKNGSQPETGIEMNRSKDGLAAANQRARTLVRSGAEPVHIASHFHFADLARRYRSSASWPSPPSWQSRLIQGRGRCLYRPFDVSRVHWRISARPSRTATSRPATSSPPCRRPDDRKIAILPLPSWTVWKDDRREASAPRSYGAMKRP